MKTLRRFGLLGICAAIGVGWAVIVGICSSPTNDPIKSSKTALTAAAPVVVVEEAKRQQDVIPSQLPPSPELVVTLPPPPAEPIGPVIAQPHPIRAQQYVPPPPPEPEGTSSGKSALPDLMKLLKERLAAPTQAMGRTSSSPVTSQAYQSPVKSTIKGEGDGKLRIHIYDEDIRKVLDLLSEQGNLNILASKNIEGKVSATLNGVDIDSALDAILKSTGYVAKREGNYVFVGTPEDFNNLEQSLDKIGTRVFQPNYITAAELKLLITPLLSEKIGAISVSSPAEAGIASNDTNAGGNKFAGNEVVVVRDFEAVLAQIDQMVEEVDVRPLQVSIEAMILSVKLKDNDKFGVNFQLLRDNPNIKFGIGSPAETLANFKFDEGGLKFGFLDTSLGTFLNALETVGDTNVVANPRVLVLNKHRADIQIGEQKGYLSSTVTETSTTYAVQFLELGAQLRLRPFISSDGLIRMEIHPELSDGDVTTVNGVTLPNKTITQVTTNVMVRDGCTVIIGGLIKDQLVTNTSQVPLLGSLPIIGIAFRNTDETIERHEVLVLITPRIVYEPGTCREGEKAACEYYRRHSTYADKMNPFGKRSIARRYFRLAQSAWAEGDQKKALRFAEMAVQFDPVNRAAIDLRSDIWLGKKEGDHTQGSERPDYNLAARNPLDGDAVADWLIDDLERPPMPQPMPLHPYDRGQPGSHQDIMRPTKLQ
jgi:type IV pilus assembly protein PilQ